MLSLTSPSSKTFDDYGILFNVNKNIYDDENKYLNNMSNNEKMYIDSLSILNKALEHKLLKGNALFNKRTDSNGVITIPQTIIIVFGVEMSENRKTMKVHTSNYYGLVSNSDITAKIQSETELSDSLNQKLTVLNSSQANSIRNTDILFNKKLLAASAED